MGSSSERKIVEKYPNSKEINLLKTIVFEKREAGYC